MYSLFAAEQKARNAQLDALDYWLEELNKYRLSLAEEIKKLEPAQEVNEDA